MPQCSVPFCQGRGGHKFPMEKKKQMAWLVAIKRANTKAKGDIWKPGKAARVCAHHFSNDDYVHLNTYGKGIAVLFLKRSES